MKAPHDLEAERDVIASAMQDAEAWAIAREQLTPEDFFSRDHGRIWAAAKAAHAAGDPIDPVSLGPRLRNAGESDALLQATGRIPRPNVVEQRCRRVRDLAAMRAVVHRALSLAASAGEAEDPGVWLDEAEKALQEAARGRYEDGVFLPLSAAINESVSHLTARADRGGGIEGHASGLADLDRMLCGWCPGRLTIIAGRPGSGKSALAKDVALGIVRSTGLPGLFASLEMPMREVGDRVIVSAGRVDYRAYRAATPGADGMRRAMEAANDHYELPLYVSERPGMSMAFLSRWAHRLKRRFGELSCIVLDYLQLMGWVGPKVGREERVSENAQGLKTLAKEIGCPVIVVSSLNRGVEQRADKRPTMADLRESGSIEYAADTILLVHREEKRPERMKVLIAKNRAGETGPVDLHFAGQFVKVDSAVRHVPDEIPEDHYGRWGDDDE